MSRIKSDRTLNCLEMITILYNLILLVTDIVTLGIIQQSKKLKIALGMCFVLMIGGVLLAILLGKNGFDQMRLCSYAVFLHLTVVLIGCILVSYRSNKLATVFISIFVFLLIGVAVDAFLIEPKQLEQNTFTITSSKIRKPKRIVVLSDLQADQFRDFERKALDFSVKQNPDLVLLTGDYFQTGDEFHRKSLIKAANSYLKSIRFDAPLGIYAVKGDVDEEDWTSIFVGTNVKTFVETQTFHVEDLCVTALSRSDSRNISLKIPPESGFHIVFGHSPNFARGDVSADLLIAGHTHGGQFQLPLIGPLYVHSKVPRKWAAGLTNLSGNRQLIVSRGIGMERGNAPQMRFLCKPELVIIDLVPQ